MVTKELVPAVVAACLGFLAYALLTGFSGPGLLAAGGVALVTYCIIEVGRTGGRVGMLALQIAISGLSGAAAGFYGAALVSSSMAQGEASGSALLHGISRLGPPIGIVTAVVLMTILLWRRWPPTGINAEQEQEP